MCNFNVNTISFHSFIVWFYVWAHNASALVTVECAIELAGFGVALTTCEHFQKCHWLVFRYKPYGKQGYQWRLCIYYIKVLPSHEDTCVVPNNNHIPAAHTCGRHRSPDTKQLECRHLSVAPGWILTAVLKRSYTKWRLERLRIFLTLIIDSCTVGFLVITRGADLISVGCWDIRASC